MLTRKKEVHFMMIKRSIYQEDIIIINIYAPNIRAPKCITQIQKVLKGEIDSNTMIVEDFNILNLTMDSLPIQKINKQMLDWRHTLANGPNRCNRTFHPIAKEYTFFSSTHGGFSRVDHDSSKNKFYQT